MALSAIVVVALVAVPARRASAAVNCVFDGVHTDTVTSSGTSVTFSRNVDALDVNGVPCGTINASPAVTSVNVDMGAVGNAFLTFDLGGGQFAAGRQPGRRDQLPGVEPRLGTPGDRGGDDRSRQVRGR